MITISKIDDTFGAYKSFVYTEPGEAPIIFSIHTEASQTQLASYLEAQQTLQQPTRPVAIGYVICKNHDLSYHINHPKEWGWTDMWLVIRERLNANGWIIDRDYCAAGKNRIEACLAAGEYRNTIPTAYIRIYQPAEQEPKP